MIDKQIIQNDALGSSYELSFLSCCGSSGGCSI